LDFRVREEDAMDENFETPDLSEFLDVLREAVLPVVRQADGTESDGQATGVLLRSDAAGLTTAGGTENE
jgi:hypothetical protein